MECEEDTRPRRASSKARGNMNRIDPSCRLLLKPSRRTRPPGFWVIEQIILALLTSKHLLNRINLVDSSLHVDGIDVIWESLYRDDHWC